MHCICTYMYNNTCRRKEERSKFRCIMNTSNIVDMSMGMQTPMKDRAGADRSVTGFWDTGLEGGGGGRGCYVYM